MAGDEDREYTLALRAAAHKAALYARDVLADDRRRHRQLIVAHAATVGLSVILAVLAADWRWWWWCAGWCLIAAWFGWALAWTVRDYWASRREPDGVQAILDLIRR